MNIDAGAIEKADSDSVRNALRNKDTQQGGAGEPADNPPRNKGGRPKGSKDRPSSVLAAELVSKQLLAVLRADKNYIASLKQHEQVQLLKTFAPIMRRLAEDHTGHTDERTFTIRFDGAVTEPTPLPDGTRIPELEGGATASEATASEAETTEPSPGVTVDALRAAAAEQDAIAAEDAAEAAERETLARRYQSGFPGHGYADA